MKKVLITVRGIQGEGKQKETIEFMTEGTMRKNGEERILCYNDTQLLGDTDKSGVKTRVRADGDKKVTIERNGNLSAKLIIEKGVRTSCVYAVPQGDLLLGIYGKSIENALNDSGGKLSMTYSIDANLQHLSENTIEITVKEVQ